MEGALWTPLPSRIPRQSIGSLPPLLGTGHEGKRLVSNHNLNKESSAAYNHDVDTISENDQVIVPLGCQRPEAMKDQLPLGEHSLYPSKVTAVDGRQSMIREQHYCCGWQTNSMAILKSSEPNSPWMLNNLSGLLAWKRCRKKRLSSSVPPQGGSGSSKRQADTNHQVTILLQVWVYLIPRNWNGQNIRDKTSQDM
uniref:Uncharacterized protein n=1 Tax=Oryza brachyantha TaxID=4533 RepID=J3MSG1_ORYBR